MGIIYSLAYAIFYSCWKRKCQMLPKHVICQITFPSFFKEIQSPRTEIWKSSHFLASLSLSISHKSQVLPISLLSISNIPPLFSILNVHHYISFSLGPLESLLSFHSAFFLSLIPFHPLHSIQENSFSSWIWSLSSLRI